MVTWEASQEATASHSIVPPRGLVPLPAPIYTGFLWGVGGGDGMGKWCMCSEVGVM